MPATKGVFSCVVDANPKFHLEVLRWYATLTRSVGVSPEDMVVHAVSGTHSDVLDYLSSQGVVVEGVEPFDLRSPTCNKIAGALSLAKRGVDGVAVLTDTDVVVLDDPRAVDVGSAKIGIRIVGGPNPPLPVLEHIFEVAGLEAPPLVPFDWRPAELTFATHGNGGLYLVPAPVLSSLADAWSRWARWLLERTDMLERWIWFVDQIGFTLAMADANIEPQRLDIRWNYPWGKAKRSPADVSPSVIHYHRYVTSGGLLKETGVPAVDQRIDTANSMIEEVWGEAFPNASYWDWRYRTNPDPSSQQNDRSLEDKRDLIAAVVETLGPESVLDIGCGDGAATKGIEFNRYVGLDVSAEAVKRANPGCVGAEYLVGTLAEHDLQADLTICLDVLTYQPNESVYSDLVTRLLKSCRGALLVSGYERPPPSTGPINRFHEPISVTLQRLAPECETYSLDEIDGTATLLTFKPSFRREPGRDSLESIASRVRQLREAGKGPPRWAATAASLAEWPSAAYRRGRNLLRRGR